MTIALSTSQYLQTRSICLPRQLKGDKQAGSPRLANACDVLYQDAPTSASPRAKVLAKRCCQAPGAALSAERDQAPRGRRFVVDTSHYRSASHALF